MTWAMWLPSIVSSGVVAVLTLAGGYLLKATIESGVKHGFDRELERLKSELKDKGEQISAIRSGTLSALASRHEALDQRRLKAAEDLWAATIYQGKFKMALSFVNTLNVEAVLKRSAEQTDDGAKLRQFGEMIWQSSNIDRIVKEQPAVPDTERLFVPPMAWAAYAAYRTVMGAAVVILATIKTGMEPSILKGNDEINKAVKLVLPHYSAFLDQYPDTGVFHLVEQLEEKVFSELLASFSDTENDRRTIDRAAQIVSYAQEASGDLAAMAETLPQELKAKKPTIS